MTTTSAKYQRPHSPFLTSLLPVPLPSQLPVLHPQSASSVTQLSPLLSLRRQVDHSPIANHATSSTWPLYLPLHPLSQPLPNSRQNMLLWSQQPLLTTQSTPWYLLRNPHLTATPLTSITTFNMNTIYKCTVYYDVTLMLSSSLRAYVSTLLILSWCVL